MSSLASKEYNGYKWAADNPGGFPPQVPYNYQEYQAPVPGKKKKGCAGCLAKCLTFIGVIILGTLVFYWFSSHRDSRNLVLGKSEVIIAQNIPSSGGTLKIPAASSGLSGMVIEVPDMAYDRDINFTISASPISSYVFGVDFNPVTPLIKVENGGAYAQTPMTVTIPVSLSENEFAMGFYYDRKSGKLEGMPVISQSSTEITVGATHFSEFLITRVLKDKFNDIQIRTGYSPGRDDWQFVNYGSCIAAGGHCAGQAMSSMWYYSEKGVVTGQRLFGKFDNNGSQNKTPLFQWDDSFGYRFASEIQFKSKWDTIIHGLFDKLVSKSDRITYYSFAYAMSETNMPQLLTIYGTDSRGNPAGHAIVAYKIDGSRIYVADPNFPGRNDRYIEFNSATGSFNPYSSGANAQDISSGNPIVFTEFCYIPVSSVMNWDTIGREYQKVLLGNVGNDDFPDKCTIERLVGYNKLTGEEIWEKCPEEFSTDIAKTTEVSKALAGQIKLRVTGCRENQSTDLYDGTNLQIDYIRPDDKGVTAILPITLKTGLNDIGLRIQYKAGKDAKGNDTYTYANFKRVLILYDDVDLSGSWQIEAAATSGSILKFVREILAQAIYRMKFTDTLEKAREVMLQSSSIEPAIFGSTATSIVFEKNDPNNSRSYLITVNYTSDDKAYTVSSKTEVKENGKFKFRFWDPAGKAVIYFTGSIQGDKLLGGDFNINMLGVFPNSLQGTWKMTKKQ